LKRVFGASAHGPFSLYRRTPWLTTMENEGPGFV
jgi:hypothetical protein